MSSILEVLKAPDMTPDSGAVHQQLAHTDKQEESPVNTQLPIVSVPSIARGSKNLTGSSKATWDTLFDTNSKINCKLTYDDYTLLWNTLGGKIKANKLGSHRGLRDRHDFFVGTIVELHGPKDSCYEPRAIKKLREMVNDLIERNSKAT